MLVCRRQPTKRRAKMAKTKRDRAFAELYSKERAKKYVGEESFMNTLHPFEQHSKSPGKKSSPLQKAIIECINLKGGSASETEILDYIVQKWDIISKYSEREFHMEPNIRIVRLNCAVKKKARHLFLKDPNRKNAWILNSAPRKIPNKKKILYDDSCSSSDEIMISDSEPEEFIEPEQNTQTECACASDLSLIEVIHRLLKNSQKPLKFEEIVEQVADKEALGGPFPMLPLKRRVRACLITLKCQGFIFQENNPENWAANPNSKNDYPLKPCSAQLPPGCKSLSLSKWFHYLKEKGVY